MRSPTGSFVLGMFTGMGLTVVLAVGLVVFMVGLGMAGIESGELLKTPSYPVVGAPVSEWAMTTVDGTPVEIGNFDERVLFVNRWATWCGPCIIEMPEIERLTKRMQGHDVAFLIVSKEPQETVAPFVEEKGWDVPVYLSSELPPQLNTKALPTTYILDANREVAFKYLGIAGWNDDTTVEFIESLIAKAGAEPANDVDA